MGVDLYDVHDNGDPIDGGAYFRSNWWFWRPIVAHLHDIAPDLIDGVQTGSNDGDGLDAADSHELAARITAQADSGALFQWVTAWEVARAAIPREQCPYCHGTGVRTDAIGIAHGMVERRWCNGCDGTGTREAPAAAYPADYDLFIEFRDFLEGVTNRFAIY